MRTAKVRLEYGLPSPVAFSSIRSRPQFDWPASKRLAVYFALNLEDYSPDGGLIETLQPASLAPDVLNWSWCEYGNRVGAWRLLELFEEFGLPLTVLVNSRIFRLRAGVVAPFLDRGDEIAAHGRTNSERQAGMDEAAERELILDATAEITAAVGNRPAGWLSPWISETPHTLGLLREAGFQYLLDWAMDDQPAWLDTPSGQLLAVPYPQELNDSSTIIGRHAGVEEFCSMINDQFDEMLDQSARQPLVFAVALHSHIAGQPFRLRALRRSLQHIARRREEVWLTTAGAIAQSFSQQFPSR